MVNDKKLKDGEVENNEPLEGKPGKLADLIADLIPTHPTKEEKEKGIPVVGLASKIIKDLKKIRRPDIKTLTQEELEQFEKELEHIVKSRKEGLGEKKFVVLNKLHKYFADWYSMYYAAAKALEESKNPDEIYDEYLRQVREELKKRGEILKNRYIELEVEDEQGNKKKLKVSVAFLIDKITEKFGDVLWANLAIRLPPPEMWLVVIKALQELYYRVYRWEAAMVHILDYLFALNMITEKILLKYAILDKQLEFILKEKYPELYEEYKRLIKQKEGE